MIDFFRTLFRPASPSGATAKERLRLVLLSDHLSLAPDVVEALKQDLLAVISRYVEIDSDHADVTFEHREREVAMLASIPIRGVRERRAARPPGPPGPLEPAAEGPPPAVNAPLDAAPPEPAQPPPDVALEPQHGAAAAPATATIAAATSANGARPRRRRRKKAAAVAGAQRPLAPPAVGAPAAQA
jgi:cell division topological specificity factor